MAASGECKPDIVLNSPVGAKPAVYKWPLTYVLKGQKIDGAEEIVETIKWVSREYLEFKPAIENLLPDQPDLRSYECIKSLCDRYNRITEMVLKMNKGTSVALKTSSRASQGLLKHIIQQVYNYAVTDPTELNKYSPFSSETYGETSFEFMAQLIEKNQFRPKENDTFIDMGSGVGHLVLQMAGSVECKKCYGIEISSVPAGYAKVMEERFRFWMNWHGKTYSEFELFHGDFFDKKYADLIKNANYIFVNNYAFKPEVDHKLKQRFLDLRDGVQILSSKVFCSQKRRVNERHLSDIGSIMSVKEIVPEQKKDTVSWTNKPLPYFLHTLDSRRVAKYFEKQKRKRDCPSEKGKPSKLRRTGKGSESLSDDSDDNIYGPTTRRAWVEYCNANNASNRTSTESVNTTSSRNNSTDTENYESAIEESNKNTEIEAPKQRERKSDAHAHDRSTSSSSHQGTSSAQGKGNQSAAQAAKSCLDKKRDYAIKKGGSNLLKKAPPSALYSISKPADGSSTSKIPNIVIKVKPTIEAKVAEDKPTSFASVSSQAAKKASTSKEQQQQQQQEKANIENGTKKLRQRKKSTTNQNNVSENQNNLVITTTTTTTTPATSTQAAAPAAAAATPTATTSRGSSKSEAKSPRVSSAAAAAAASSNSILNLAPNGTRAKKAQPAAKNSGKATTSASRKKSSASKACLEFLHDKTVESVSSNAGCFPRPAPGCEDHNLRSIVDTPSLPKVVIKDSSMFVNEFLKQKTTIEKRFMECTRHELDRFAKKLQHPQASEMLMREIERERERNRLLYKERDDLMRDIKLLSDRIPTLVGRHCDELNIRNSPRSIVGHLGLLLKQHQELVEYHMRLEALAQSSTHHPHHQRMAVHPPAAHSGSSSSVASQHGLSSASSYLAATPSPATLDLSLKQSA